MGSFNKCSLSHYLILSSRLQEERPLSDNFLIADFVSVEVMRWRTWSRDSHIFVLLLKVLILLSLALFFLEMCRPPLFPALF
jgi:hypothetical protein